MFQALRLEVLDRFTAVERFFKQSKLMRGEPHQIAKGLMFVQVYAVHEYTVATVVRVAVDSITSRSHRYADLRPSLLALFLHTDFSSLRNCAQRREWEQRIALLDRANLATAIQFHGDIPLPTDGSHFRHTHIALILKVFGINKRPTARVRHQHLIDEVVENRNAIAHGRETSADIGKRYSRGDVRRMIVQMRSACLRLIMLLEEHCIEPSNSCR